MWLKAQNEMAGLLPHAAMGPVERMVRRHRVCSNAMIVMVPVCVEMNTSCVLFEKRVPSDVLCSTHVGPMSVDRM